MEVSGKITVGNVKWNCSRADGNSENFQEEVGNDFEFTLPTQEV